MLSDHFVSANRATWERLSALLDRVEAAGLPALTPDELGELGRLYRRVTAQLSEARTANLERETIDYLNQLAARAYTRVSAGSRPRRLRLGHLFAVEVPRTFRARARAIGLAVALSVIAAAVAYSAARSDPRWARALTNPEAVANWEQFAGEDHRPGDYFAPTAAGYGGPEFASFLMSNNIRVALNAFALGVTLGLGTVYVLIVNGLMLGAFLAVGGNGGKLLLFAAIVAPHGVTELSAIFIAGGAGLTIGFALVDPGDLRRKDALRLAAADALRLVVGTIPMFVVAGVIEALVSPQTGGLFAGAGPRIAFGLLIGVAFWLCLMFGDRLWHVATPIREGDAR